MDEKRRTDGKSGAGEPPPSPLRPSSTGPPGRLSGQTGPVSLGAGKRGIVTLGDIAEPGRKPPHAHLGQAPGARGISPPPPGVAERPVAEAPRGPAPGGVVSPSGSTAWSPTRWTPRIDPSSYVHPTASVIGNVIVAAGVFIAAGAAIRGDNEEPIFIGEGSTIQECAVIRDLPTRRGGDFDQRRVVEVDGSPYTVHIGKVVSICAQAQVHGPARVADGVYIGAQSLVFWARVDNGAVVEPGCLIMNVRVPSGRFVPAGLKVTNEKIVGDLPVLTSRYRFHDIGRQTASDNRELLKGYREL